METKLKYEAPRVEVIQLEAEQPVLAGSVNGWGDQGQIDDDVYGRRR